MEKQKVKLIILFAAFILSILLVFLFAPVEANLPNYGKNITTQDMQEYVERCQSEPTFKGFYDYMKNKGY